MIIFYKLLNLYSIVIFSLALTAVVADKNTAIKQKRQVFICFAPGILFLVMIFVKG